MGAADTATPSPRGRVVIEGGSVPDRRLWGNDVPITARYVVTWVDTTGRRQVVKSPAVWIGLPLSDAQSARFRDAVARAMDANPPAPDPERGTP